MRRTGKQEHNSQVTASVHTVQAEEGRRRLVDRVHTCSFQALKIGCVSLMAQATNHGDGAAMCMQCRDDHIVGR